MLKDASWLVAAFLILTVSLAGMCAKITNKKDKRSPRHKTERVVPIPEKVPPKAQEYKIGPNMRDYTNPRDYVIHRSDKAQS